MDKLLNKILLAIVFLALVFVSCNRDSLRIKVDISDNSPQVLHGIEKLKDLEKDGICCFY
jgi:PBP1b-binding outer membrane lipoprotein LpoB